MIPTVQFHEITRIQFDQITEHQLDDGRKFASRGLILTDEQGNTLRVPFFAKEARSLCVIDRERERACKAPNSGTGQAVQS
jgi:hypothetical protein